MNAQQVAATVSLTNLDYIAAQQAQQLVQVVPSRAKADEAANVFTKVLGVLQENGVYGMFLFLLSRSGKVNSSPGNSEEHCCARTVYHAIQMLNSCLGNSPYEIAENRVNREKNPILEHVLGNVCSETYQNILAKSVLEKFLIYARYHAKGLTAGGDSNDD